MWSISVLFTFFSIFNQTFRRCATAHFNGHATSRNLYDYSSTRFVHDCSMVQAFLRFPSFIIFQFICLIFMLKHLRWLLVAYEAWSSYEITRFKLHWLTFHLTRHQRQYSICGGTRQYSITLYLLGSYIAWLKSCFTGLVGAIVSNQLSDRKKFTNVQNNFLYKNRRLSDAQNPDVWWGVWSRESPVLQILLTSISNIRYV